MEFFAGYEPLHRYKSTLLFHSSISFQHFPVYLPKFIFLESFSTTNSWLFTHFPLISHYNLFVLLRCCKLAIIQRCLYNWHFQKIPALFKKNNMVKLLIFFGQRRENLPWKVHYHLLKYAVKLAFSACYSYLYLLIERIPRFIFFFLALRERTWWDSYYSAFNKYEVRGKADIAQYCNI